MSKRWPVWTAPSAAGCGALAPTQSPLCDRDEDSRLFLEQGPHRLWRSIGCDPCWVYLSVHTYLKRKRLPLKNRLLLDTVRTWLDFSSLTRDKEERLSSEHAQKAHLHMRMKLEVNKYIYNTNQDFKTTQSELRIRKITLLSKNMTLLLSNMFKLSKILQYFVRFILWICF